MPQTRTIVSTATWSLLAGAAVTSFLLPRGLPSAGAQTADPDELAVFTISGEATTGPDGRWGDAILESVAFPTGDVFTEFICAKAITGFAYDGPTDGISVATGTSCTVGEPGWFKLENEDGAGGSISDADRALFNERILASFRNRNLNSLVCNAKDASWSFTIEFDELVRDNDETIDTFGEILYVERGADAGNSWLLVRAVDADGQPLGSWLALDPAETLPPSPETWIGAAHAPHLTNQTIGVSTIDLTRLGVSELRYLEVASAVPGIGGYVSGEKRPDFKIFVVMTGPRLPDPINVYD